MDTLFSCPVLTYCALFIRLSTNLRNSACFSLNSRLKHDIDG